MKRKRWKRVVEVDKSPPKTPQNSFIGHLCVGTPYGAMAHLAQPFPSIRTMCGKTWAKYVPYPGVPALVCEVCKNV